MWVGMGATRRRGRGGVGNGEGVLLGPVVRGVAGAAVGVEAVGEEFCSGVDAVGEEGAVGAVLAGGE